MTCVFIWYAIYFGGPDTIQGRQNIGETLWWGELRAQKYFSILNICLWSSFLFSQGWSQWEKETNLAGSALPGWLNEQTCGQALLRKEKCRRLLPGFQQRRLGNDMPTFVFLKLSRKVSPHWYDRKYFFFRYTSIYGLLCPIYRILRLHINYTYIYIYMGAGRRVLILKCFILCLISDKY